MAAAPKRQQSKREKLEAVRAQLETEIASFKPHWRELSDYILPRRARFLTSDTNKGNRRNLNIIDSSPSMAARVLRSGMMSGVTSPARPWKRITTPDPELAEISSVKEWLHSVDRRMDGIFLRSNLYNVLPTIYGDMGTFGTAAMLIEEDFNKTIRCQALPIGSYMISNNEKLEVNVFFREFRMTVRNMVERFARESNGKMDWSRVSDHVRSQWEEGQLEQWIDVRHVIMPNDMFDEKRKMNAKFKRYASCYYEAGSYPGTTSSYLRGRDDDKYLSESGYDYFPILCPRWETTGEDVYGTDCPGMIALGDIKQLQLGEKRIAQAIEKMVNPPLQGSLSLRNSRVSLLPGDVTHVAETNSAGGGGYRPIHEVNPRILELENKQAQIRDRINKAFFADLFLMLANSDRRQITAREIDERHEEKLLALGPVLEQLNQDLLDPLIDITFDMMERQKLIPPPPKELMGVKLRVDYISIMAQAQRMIGINSVERVAGFAGQVAQVMGNPEVLDKIDADQLLDVYGDMLSITPGIVRPDDAVAKIRAARARSQQEQKAIQDLQVGAQAAKDLASANLEGDNALNQILSAGVGAGLQ